jgi:hypothetical protein
MKPLDWLPRIPAIITLFIKTSDTSSVIEALRTERPFDKIRLAVADHARRVKAQTIRVLLGKPLVDIRNPSKYPHRR